ncbi:MAG TPA: type III-B CRISPR module RAMP protein Cmr4, partial [Anaerolineae bacterium]|nr:type III-B CRISPR module RAMP protein Cmr4 [Anaerolineae bacterium]
MNAKLVFVYALTPLHPGTGRGIGVIDLPVARETATGIPYLPGSSFKGVLRDQCLDKNMRKSLFGPDTDNASDHAGAVQFSDQRLLLMPVRSLAGTFAWVTSPFVLRRFAREHEGAGLNGCPPLADVAGEQTAVISTESKLVVRNDHIILEDLKLQKDKKQNANAWAETLGGLIFPDDAEWQTFLKERLCVVHDDIFSFLLETATELIARVRINDDSKTVQTGGLWYEEALPAETILSGVITAQQIKANKLKP